MKVLVSKIRISDPIGTFECLQKKKEFRKNVCRYETETENASKLYYKSGPDHYVGCVCLWKKVLYGQRPRLPETMNNLGVLLAAAALHHVSEFPFVVSTL
jgi:hypothetical protein